MLKNLRPETDEAAADIVDKAEMRWRKLQLEQAKRDEDAEQEIESILDGPPPELPPSIVPPEPQKLETGDAWEGQTLFDAAMNNLFEVHTQPAARFIGWRTVNEMRKILDFVTMVVKERETAEKAKAAPTKETIIPTVDDDQDIPAFLLNQDRAAESV